MSSKTNDVPAPNSSTTAAADNVVTFNARRAYRERDFGIGYGKSSGYAANKRYTNDWCQPRFRCA